MKNEKLLLLKTVKDRLFRLLNILKVLWLSLDETRLLLQFDTLLLGIYKFFKSSKLSKFCSLEDFYLRCLQQALSLIAFACVCC